MAHSGAGGFAGGRGFGNFDPNIVIREGRGARVWDEDGGEYVDFLIGSGPMILGHGHPEVIEAVERQLSKGMTFFANNSSGIELAEGDLPGGCLVPTRCVLSVRAARRTCTQCAWRGRIPGVTRS